MDSCVQNPCPGQVTGTPALVFQQLILTLYASQCGLGNPNDYPPDYGPQLTDGQEFDFIVVGGGTAGSILSRRLSEITNWKILLIEAGGNPPAISDIPSFTELLRGTEIDWTYQSVPQKTCCLGMNEKRCVYPRGKVLGGSSTINGIFYVRGNQQDFDEWERLGNKGWGYKDILQYYKKIENLQPDIRRIDEVLHSRSGLLPVSLSVEDPSFHFLTNALMEGATAVGYGENYDVNGNKQIGFTVAQRNMLNGRRQNLAKAYLGAGTISNLFVAKFSEVQNLILNAGRVTGVNLTRPDGTYTVNAKKEVILSAGSLNTPKILLRSGIGPFSSLGLNIKKLSPGVGNNLQDQYMYFGAMFIVKGAISCGDSQEIVDGMAQYLLQPENPGLLATDSYSNVIGFVDTQNTKGLVPDIEYHTGGFCGSTPDTIRDFFAVQNFADDIIEQIPLANANESYFMLIPILLRPKSEGSVRLNGSNPAGPPLIDPKSFSHPDDVATMARGIQTAIRILESPPFKALQPRQVEFNIPNCAGLDSEARIKCQIPYLSTSIFHPVGTCKMGSLLDPMAVVDSRLRFHGLSGLRVIDASVFPHITRGNTNAPTMMVAEKGADMIKQDYGVVAG